MLCLFTKVRPPQLEQSLLCSLYSGQITLMFACSCYSAVAFVGWSTPASLHLRVWSVWISIFPVMSACLSAFSLFLLDVHKT